MSLRQFLRFVENDLQHGDGDGDGDDTGGLFVDRSGKGIIVDAERLRKYEVLNSRDVSNDKYLKQIINNLQILHNDNDKKLNAIFVLRRSGDNARKLVDEAIYRANLLGGSTTATGGNRNRCFSKLSEMDAETSLISNNKILFFADLCCAPGGFAEYISSVKRHSALGYGITLNAELGGVPMNNDDSAFRRNEWPVFEYDIITENIPALPKVTLVLADGATTQHNRQSTRVNIPLIKSELVWARRLLRQNGNLLLKTFSLFNYKDDQLTTLHTILRTLDDYFESVVVLKPRSSRALNDERYIYAIGFSVKRKNVGKDRLPLFKSILLHAELIIQFRRAVLLRRINEQLLARK